MAAWGRKHAWLALSALAVAPLLLLSSIAFLWTRSEAPIESGAREFTQLLRDLESPVVSTAMHAALKVPRRRELFWRPERFSEMGRLYSGDRISVDLGEERLGVARTFWRGIFALQSPAGLHFVPPGLSSLRHAYLLLRAQEERPEALEDLSPGEGGPSQSAAMGDLVKEIFRLPAPSRENLGPLLWDRANLEEMGGKAAEALESFRLLNYDRVRDHPEFDGRFSYLIAKADLLGRIRKRFSASDIKASPALEKELGLGADAELSSFRAEDGGAMGPLIDGIDLLHRGEFQDADRILSGYLQDAEEGSGKGVLPGLVISRARQRAALLRSMARMAGAEQSYRSGEAFTVAPAASTVASRGVLSLRLARLLAALSLREEFDSLAADLGRGDPGTTALFDAVAGAVWGDPQHGGARLREVLESRKDLPEKEAWEELASGPPAPDPRGYFEAGQICDELGDVARLERIIGHLEFAVEKETEVAYLAFLRAVLRLRRGEVVEAWADLEKCLDRPTFPPGLSRQAVARFMEGAEKAADALARTRGLLEAVDRELSSLRALRKEIDPGVALGAAMKLWAARTAGEAVHPAYFGPRSASTPELLSGIEAELKAARHSYEIDRAWIDLRNAVGRSFRRLAQANQLDAALSRLDELRRLVRGSAGIFGREEAEIRLERGMRMEAMDRKKALADFHRAGELFLEVAREEDASGGVLGSAAAEEPRRDAANAFERAGDPEALIRAFAPIEASCRDEDLLIRFARALLARGELARAREVLWRALALGEEVVQVVEEPGDPIHLGGYHFSDPPEELTAWLDLYPFVDPINGTGSGRLRYQPGKRTLEWRAPGESRFGPPVFLPDGEMVRLSSGDDPQKTILVGAGPSKAERKPFPIERGEWELAIVFREFPVDPLQLEARLALAEATLRLARIQRFDGAPEAAAFIERHLGGGGDAGIRKALASLIGQTLTDLYREPPSAAILKTELDRQLSAWRRWVREEAAPTHLSSDDRREWLQKLSGRLDEISGRTGDGARVAEFLRQGEPEIQERLRSFKVSVIRLLLERENFAGPVRATLEELSRDLLDSQAREELYFLCEHVGNRSPLWRRATYLRAFQLERRAEEAASARGDRAVLGPPGDPAALAAEAREVYQRLLSVAAFEDGPDWIARAHVSLARLLARSGRIHDAKGLLDRLAEANVEGLGAQLPPPGQAELGELSVMADFFRADLAHRSGDLVEAARLYAGAIQKHPGSPRVLWAHLQLGADYEAQGLPEDAYREYQKGKELLAGRFAEPEVLAGWLRGGRSEVLESIGRTFPSPEGKELTSLLEPPTPRPSDRAFWESLFDVRLKALAGR